MFYTDRVSKLCPNCGETFRQWVKVNGKRINIGGSRIYCTDCHPIGTKGRIRRPDRYAAVIKQMLIAGESYTTIMLETHRTRSTIRKYAIVLGLAERKSGPLPKKFDWSIIQIALDTGTRHTKCMRQFGISSTQWSTAIAQKLIVSPGAYVIPIDELCARREQLGRFFKTRLIKAGLLDSICGLCSINSWCNKPLTLQLDHLNGDRTDNRLPNLRLLCPNCHSQTDTYSGRNKFLRRAAFESGILSAKEYNVTNINGRKTGVRKHGDRSVEARI